MAKSKIPVCFILNETKTYEQCVRGVGLGFNVVMLDMPRALDLGQRQR